MEYRYNRQGERIQLTDQNGTVHEYLFDKLGRPVSDRVTSVGAGIDTAVRRIDRDYSNRGQLERLTSYAEPEGVTTVNEVLQHYNDFGQLVQDYQEHAGAVDIPTAPTVRYSYADGRANHTRLRSVTYPNGRLLHYGYATASDDALSRVTFLADLATPPLPLAGEGRGEGANDSRRGTTPPRPLAGEGWGEGGSGTVPPLPFAGEGRGEGGCACLAQHLADYRYLGASQITQLDYPQPTLRADYDAGQPGTYSGLDRFGRVVDLRWWNTTTGDDLERTGHGYDAAGSRLWRQCPVAATAGHPADELYTYDGMNQLQSLDRGRLNEARTGLVTDTKTFAEQWSLDPTGNWSAYQQDADGDNTWDLDQSRTHDAANEIVDINCTVGELWISPLHDRAGNMTRTPQPADPTQAFGLEYDAWNRLVRVTAGDHTVAEYEYDARNFRTLKRVYSGGALAELRHFYYNSNWQVLEERVSPIPNPQSLIPASQYVWGLRYIDDLVLRDRDTNGDGALDERLYALQDPNWNVTALVGSVPVNPPAPTAYQFPYLFFPFNLGVPASANLSVPESTWRVVERYRYSAYGTPLFLDASGNILVPQPSASPLANPYLYTGRQLDAEYGQYHYRARSYGAALGRFASRDPIGYRGGINLYEYVHGRVLVACDPTGTLDLVIFKSIVVKQIDQELLRGVYGHWWIEIDGSESYGWWPLPNVDSLEDTLKGVPGELNGVTNHGGTPTKDPHHGDHAKNEWEAIRAGDWLSIFATRRLQFGSKKRTRCSCVQEGDVKECIRAFAKDFASKNKTWEWPLGPNCHTFQEDLIKACCINSGLFHIPGAPEKPPGAGK